MIDNTIQQNPLSDNRFKTYTKLCRPRLHLTRPARKEDSLSEVTLWRTSLESRQALMSLFQSSTWYLFCCRREGPYRNGLSYHWSWSLQASSDGRLAYGTTLGLIIRQCMVTSKLKDIGWRLHSIYHHQCGIFMIYNTGGSTTHHWQHTTAGSVARCEFPFPSVNNLY